MSKTQREFLCRDDLWTRVQALAKRRGISTDDVVQAALLQLFKGGSKKKKADSSKSGSKPVPPPTTPPRPRSGPSPSAKPPGPPSLKSTRTRLPHPSGGSSKPTLPRPKTGSARLPPPTSRKVAKQPRKLYLCYLDNWYVVEQDEFVIGRGAKYSDLPIKDANISRRHCSIVRRGEDYFIKDLGSTNGVEYEGERVDDHKVTEGSTYFLCDHELKFSFHEPG